MNMACAMDVREELSKTSGNYVKRQGRANTFANRNTILCYQCQKQGHYQFECPSLEKEANYVEFDKKEELLLSVLWTKGYGSLILVV